MMDFKCFPISGPCFRWVSGAWRPQAAINRKALQHYSTPQKAKLATPAFPSRIATAQKPSPELICTLNGPPDAFHHHPAQLSGCRPCAEGSPGCALRGWVVSAAEGVDAAWPRTLKLRSARKTPDAPNQRLIFLALPWTSHSPAASKNSMNVGQMLAAGALAAGLLTAPAAFAEFRLPPIDSGAALASSDSAIDAHGGGSDGLMGTTGNGLTVR